MAKRYRNLIKWALYSLAFLLVLLLNTAALGSRTFFGAKLSLVPVYVTCVACREGHEKGGLFALAAGLFWSLSGAAGGAMFVLMLPVAAVVSGYFTATYLSRTLLPAMAGCLLALVLCEGGIYLLRLYMAQPLPSDAAALLGIQIACSMVTAPLFWWLTRLIGKAGG